MARDDTEAAIQLDDEALAIIQRRRPDLKGKTLEEVKAIFRHEKPMTDQRRKRPR